MEPRPLPSGQGAHRAFIVRDKTPSPIRLVPARKELRHPHPGSRGRAKEKNRKRRAKRSERDRSRRRAPEPRALRLRSASPVHQRFTLRFTQLYHQRAEAKAIQDKVHKNWKNLRFADRVAVRRVLRKHFPHGSVKDAFDTLLADCFSCEERSRLNRPRAAQFAAARCSSFDSKEPRRGAKSKGLRSRRGGESRVKGQTAAQEAISKHRSCFRSRLRWRRR